MMDVDKDVVDTSSLPHFRQDNASGVRSEDHQRGQPPRGDPQGWGRPPQGTEGCAEQVPRTRALSQGHRDLLRHQRGYQRKVCTVCFVPIVVMFCDRPLG